MYSAKSVSRQRRPPRRRLRSVPSRILLRQLHHHGRTQTERAPRVRIQHHVCHFRASNRRRSHPFRPRARLGAQLPHRFRRRRRPPRLLLPPHLHRSRVFHVLRQRRLDLPRDPRPRLPPVVSRHDVHHRARARLAAARDIRPEPSRRPPPPAPSPRRLHRARALLAPVVIDRRRRPRPRARARRRPARRPRVVRVVIRNHRVRVRRSRRVHESAHLHESTRRARRRRHPRRVVARASPAARATPASPTDDDAGRSRKNRARSV